MQPDKQNIKAALFRQIFETTGDGILVTNEEGTIALVNKTLCDMTGYAQEELIGHMGAFMMAGEADAMVDEFYGDYQNGIIDIYETFYSRKDGSIFPVHLKITGAGNLPGFAGGIIICVMDITLLENARQQLASAMRDVRKSRDFLENIFNMSGDGIYVTDEMGKIIWSNRAFADMLGYEPEELLGVFPPDLAPDPDILGNETIMSIATEMFQKSATGDYYEVFYRRKNGTIFPAETKITNLMEGSQKTSAIISSIRDITLRKELEQKIKTAYTDLEHKVNERTMHLEEANTALRVLLRGRNEEKDSLEEKIAANISELVLPYIDKLNEGKVSERQRMLLEIIESNLKDIISSFSASARLTNLTPAEIKIANLIRTGKSTKEIADLLALSIRTIEGHRDSIRKKTGLKNKKANLRTYLLSLE
jgi:PAS domain S-box-containing protein